MAAVIHDDGLSVLPYRDQRVDRLCIKLTKKGELTQGGWCSIEKFAEHLDFNGST